MLKKVLGFRLVNEKDSNFGGIELVYVCVIFRYRLQLGLMPGFYRVWST
jgi:hypothetical protein